MKIKINSMKAKLNRMKEKLPELSEEKMGYKLAIEEIEGWLSLVEKSIKMNPQQCQTYVSNNNNLF